MDAGTTTGEVIDALVRVADEAFDFDARTQQLYRQNLQVLVALAKAEQRQDLEIDLALASLHYASGMAH